MKRRKNKLIKLKEIFYNIRLYLDPICFLVILAQNKLSDSIQNNSHFNINFKFSNSKNINFSNIKNKNNQHFQLVKQLN